MTPALENMSIAAFFTAIILALLFRIVVKEWPKNLNTRINRHD